MSSRSEVLSYHGVLIEQMLVSDLDEVEFLLQLLDVLFLCQLHLLEDLFLGAKFSVEIFSPSNRLIDLVLELSILLSKGLYLTVSSVELDLSVLDE